MVVRLRLARFGCRHLPFYRIFAADARAPRDGKHIEILGYYNPLPGRDGVKRIGLKIDRAKYWLSVGAQPTEPVQHILFKVGLLPRPPCPLIMSKQEAAKVVAVLREKDKAKKKIRQERRNRRRERVKAKWAKIEADKAKSGEQAAAATTESDKK